MRAPSSMRYAFVVCMVLTARLAAAAGAPYELQRVAGPVSIDGLLSEREWESAQKLTLDYQSFPNDGPARVRTEAWLAHDDASLYIAFRAYDPRPKEIRAHLRDRDGAVEDDAVGVVLDTFNDERRAYQFFVTPAGVQLDSVYIEGSKPDTSWDAIWTAESRITGDGYVVEIAIPFRAMRFRQTPVAQQWGFDLQRIYPRDSRYVMNVSPVTKTLNCYLCQGSKLIGLAGLEPGRDLEVDPTVTAWHRAERLTPQSVSTQASGDAGVSMQWGVTRNFALAATANPDFSQVEADSLELTENRLFAIRYAEKRPFFSEGYDFFSAPYDVVQTRTMADPDWGLKLTGKQGRHAVGFFVVEDQVTNVMIPGSERSRTIAVEDRNTTSAFRYRYDVAKGSTVGVVATSRRGPDYSTVLAGLDAFLRIGKPGLLILHAVRSESEYPDAVAQRFAEQAGNVVGEAYRARYRHADKYWEGMLKFEKVSSGFRADVGYVPQVDYRDYFTSLGRTWYGNENTRWSRVSLGGSYDWLDRDSDGALLRRAAEIFGGIEGPRQSFIAGTFGKRRRLLRKHLFDEQYNEVQLGVTPNGNTVLKMVVTFGDSADVTNVLPAKLFRAWPSITVNTTTHLQLGAAFVRETLAIDSGRLYAGNAVEARAVYQFNNAAFARVILQYTDIVRNPEHYIDPIDRRTREVLPHVLFSYKLNPRSVLFVGYSSTHFGSGEQIETAEMDRTVFAKIGYAWLY